MFAPFLISNLDFVFPNKVSKLELALQHQQFGRGHQKKKENANSVRCLLGMMLGWTDSKQTTGVDNKERADGDGQNGRTDGRSRKKEWVEEKWVGWKTDQAVGEARSASFPPSSMTAVGASVAASLVVVVGRRQHTISLSSACGGWPSSSFFLLRFRGGSCSCIYTYVCSSSSSIGKRFSPQVQQASSPFFNHAVCFVQLLLELVVHRPSAKRKWGSRMGTGEDPRGRASRRRGSGCVCVQKKGARNGKAKLLPWNCLLPSIFCPNLLISIIFHEKFQLPVGHENSSVALVNAWLVLV